jgi:hypothetical protein
MGRSYNGGRPAEPAARSGHCCRWAAEWLSRLNLAFHQREAGKKFVPGDLDVGQDASTGADREFQSVGFAVAVVTEQVRLQDAACRVNQPVLADYRQHLGGGVASKLAPTILEPSVLSGAC